MHICAFSALLSGVCDLGEARYTFDRLEVRRETPCFRQVFYRKPMMIADYF